MKKIHLILSNGEVFSGECFGAEKEVTGELVFTTAMTGYVETLSDPGFCGQIIVSAFPQIGNYGVMEEDMQSDNPSAAALVVREYCEQPANFRMNGTIDAFMKKYGIVGISGIDTRALISMIREHGTMNATICSDMNEKAIVRAKSNKMTEACKAVGTEEVKTFPPEGCFQYHVTVIDYGARKDLITALTARGCQVTLVPGNTAAQDILATNPDGIILSSGPGNPADYSEHSETLKDLIGQKPLLGIGLGHQLLALAMGARTFKMKCGHRGDNQPVLQPETCRTYITSQNHGYAVDPTSLPSCAKLLLINANDGTCEGLEYSEHRAFSVQFRPLGGEDANDTGNPFNRFITMMGGEV